MCKDEVFDLLIYGFLLVLSSSLFHTQEVKGPVLLCLKGVLIYDKEESRSCLQDTSLLDFYFQPPTHRKVCAESSKGKRELGLPLVEEGWYALKVTDIYLYTMSFYLLFPSGTWKCPSISRSPKTPIPRGDMKAAQFSDLRNSEDEDSKSFPGTQCGRMMDRTSPCFMAMGGHCTSLAGGWEQGRKTPAMTDVGFLAYLKEGTLHEN